MFTSLFKLLLEKNCILKEMYGSHTYKSRVEYLIKWVIKCVNGKPGWSAQKFKQFRQIWKEMKFKLWALEMVDYCDIYWWNFATATSQNWLLVRRVAFCKYSGKDFRNKKCGTMVFTNWIFISNQKKTRKKLMSEYIL